MAHLGVSSVHLVTVCPLSVSLVSSVCDEDHGLAHSPLMDMWIFPGGIKPLGKVPMQVLWWL